MEKKPVRRVVTGHDADGKAVILMDAPTPYVNQRGEGNVVQLLWITNESPADLSHTRDQANQKTGVLRPREVPKKLAVRKLYSRSVDSTPSPS